MSGNIRASWFETREDALLTMRKIYTTHPRSRFARRANLPRPTRLISPPNQQHFPAVPRPQEGRFAIVTDVGCGMRWTRWRTRRMRRSRTAKSCGPGIPTLMPSFRGDDLASDGGKKARSPRRARRKPLKPLRRECRADPAYPWWLRSCAFLFSHARLRARRAPGIPCALVFEGGCSTTRARIASREGGVVSAVLLRPNFRDAACGRSSGWGRHMWCKVRPSWRGGASRRLEPWGRWRNDGCL